MPGETPARAAAASRPQALLGLRGAVLSAEISATVSSTWVRQGRREIITIIIIIIAAIIKMKKQLDVGKRRKQENGVENRLNLKL